MSPNTHLNDSRHRSIALIILLPIPYTCEICLSPLCLQAPNENHGIIGQLIELLIEGNSFGFTFSRLFYSTKSLNITPEISRDLTLLIFVNLKSTARKDEVNWLLHCKNKRKMIYNISSGKGATVIHFVHSVVRPEARCENFYQLI